MQQQSTVEERLESFLRTHENVRSDEPVGARGGQQSKADAIRNEFAQQAAVSRLELDRQAMSQQLAADATGRRISLVQAARAQTAGRDGGSSEPPLREQEVDEEDGL